MPELLVDADEAHRRPGRPALRPGDRGAYENTFTDDYEDVTGTGRAAGAPSCVVAPAEVGRASASRAPTCRTEAVPDRSPGRTGARTRERIS
ncbi:hypothetical protein GCM10018772_23350 [Streptomyces fumanus]|uniref:Uncharacterized protein n=1 Tax=Streptomyces fumanus TaxID=67302 RepID=A0A919ABG8_9ACTN|nr:hypothetical protein GCM10018772_23350 [Streptomyces fumanus]